MPRAGSTKVRTGCFTCKSRKIKCDETRPHCQRCLASNRLCTGYPEIQGQAQYSWAHLLTSSTPTSSKTKSSPPPHLLLLPPSPPPTSLLSATEQDARALAFFRARVAPALSRHSSAPFWTVRVSQVAVAEPAVHHALAAISALYEGLDYVAIKPISAQPAALEAERARFALTHYNRALGHLRAPGTDRGVVLLVCLLFICIETLQGEKEQAIAHCRHGVLICNGMVDGGGGARDGEEQELRRMFLRLATFPYFFGTEAGEFPEPKGLAASLENGEEGKLNVSVSAWDALVNRTVRVVREGLSHRQGPLRTSPVSEGLVQSQRQTLDSLVAWREHYRAQRMACLVADEEVDTHWYREMEAIAGMIWVACCLETSETGYDAYMADFADLLALSQELIDRRSSSMDDSQPRPIFSFEMGFTPFLFFVVLKCRRLEMRVRALRHILVLGCDRENLFNTRVIYSVGLRLVELEHGVKLDRTWPECGAAVDESLPDDEMRIKTADIMEDKQVRVGEGGRREEYTKVYFLLRPEAIVPGHTEWVKTPPLSNGRSGRSGLDSTHIS